MDQKIYAVILAAVTVAAISVTLTGLVVAEKEAKQTPLLATRANSALGQDQKIEVTRIGNSDATNIRTGQIRCQPSTCSGGSCPERTLCLWCTICYCFPNQ